MSATKRAHELAHPEQYAHTPRVRVSLVKATTVPTYGVPAGAR